MYKRRTASVLTHIFVGKTRGGPVFTGRGMRGDAK